MPDQTTRQTVDVVIVGAGFAGLYALLVSPRPGAIAGTAYVIDGGTVPTT